MTRAEAIAAAPRSRKSYVLDMVSLPLLAAFQFWLASLKRNPAPKIWAVAGAMMLLVGAQAAWRVFWPRQAYEISVRIPKHFRVFAEDTSDTIRLVLNGFYIAVYFASCLYQRQFSPIVSSAFCTVVLLFLLHLLWTDLCGFTLTGEVPLPVGALRTPWKEMKPLESDQWGEDSGSHKVV